MKPFKTLIFAALISLCSCGGGGSEASSTENTDSTASALPAILQNRVTPYNLADHYIAATLLVPDSTRGIPQVVETAFGGIQLTVGSSYNIVISELAGGSIQAKAQELAEDLMYKNEIVEQGADFILYKSSITDSYVEPVFHFYALKTIGNTTYEVHDYNEEGGYAESQARFMLESVNHLQPNNPTL